jgi:dolichyl-phosphooligosaccharide-protein glycotransferase
MVEVRNPSRRRAARILGLAMLICGLMAGLVRWQHDARQQRLEDPSAWFSAEADGLYHLRRVEQLFVDGLPVTARDERLNAPFGADIPWPPYYDATVYGLAAPFAPTADQRKPFLEHFVAMLPFVFGILTSMLAAWAAWRLVPFQRSAEHPEVEPAKLIAALFAGGYFACQFGAAHYSAPGIADHHAWVSLLTLVLWILVSSACRPQSLASPKKSLGLGLASGAVAGLMMGSWVASLLAVLMVQLCLGLMLWLKTSARATTDSDTKERRGLACFGLTFHFTAALVLMPAILASPWKEQFPWMVVNLSWFHLVELLLGALVFVPLYFSQRQAVRLLPMLILGTIGASIAMNFGPGAGIRQGLAWVSRADEFMSGIAESEPLWGTDSTGTGGALTWLGYGVLLLPFAWLAMLRQCLRQGRTGYFPWLLAVPLLLVQALAQRRFSEALAAPMAVVLAWWIAHYLSKVRFAGRLRALPGALIALALAILLNGTAPVAAILQPQWTQDFAPIANAKREIYEWIGAQKKRHPRETVLASWDQGHAIEWLCNRGSVATNFGTYVGQDSYRDPSRFFLTNDRQYAHQILLERQVRYLVRDSQLSLALDQLSNALATGQTFVESFVNSKGQTRTRFKEAWWQTMAAMLGAPGPANSVPFLRLVYLSPIADNDPRHGGQVLPAGLVWEHVAGAEIVALAEPGQILRVALSINMVHDGQTLMGFRYQDSALTDAQGRASLRLPYATTAAPQENGEAQVVVAEYFLENPDGSVLRQGKLVVSNAAVQAGLQVPLP